MIVLEQEFHAFKILMVASTWLAERSEMLVDLDTVLVSKLKIFGTWDGFAEAFWTQTSQSPGVR